MSRKNQNAAPTILDIPSQHEGAILSAIVAGDGQAVVDGVSFSPHTKDENGPMGLVYHATFRHGSVRIGDETGDTTGRTFFPNNELTLVASKDGGNTALIIEFMSRRTSNSPSSKAERYFQTTEIRNVDEYAKGRALPFIPQETEKTAYDGGRWEIDIDQNGYDFLKVFRDSRTPHQSSAIESFVASEGNLSPEQEKEFYFMEDSVAALNRARELQQAARVALLGEAERPAQ